MDRDRLARALQRCGASPDAYVIDAIGDEAYCLVQERGGFSVFYSDRGSRTSERWHSSEEDACRDLLARVRGDGSARRGDGAAQGGGEPRRLPAAARHPLLVVLVGVALVGAVVALYDRGFLPVAGPFVAVVVAAVVVHTVVWTRARRLRRLVARAHALLERLAVYVEHDPVLRGDVELSLQRLGHGQVEGACQPMRGLADAAAAWPDGPARRAALELGEVEQSVRRTIARMRKVAGGHGG